MAERDPANMGLGPRNRRDPRFKCEMRLEARCSNWQSFRQLFSQNISKTGLFIATPETSKVGEQVEIKLHAPDNQTLRLTGRVRHVFDKQGAKGLGVQLSFVHDDDLQRYHALVEQAARSEVVKPTAEGAKPPPLPPGAKEEKFSNTPALGSPPVPTRRIKPAHRPKPLVAIDFGTSRSSVAAVTNRQAQVIQLPGGSWDMPSVIGFIENGQAVVGTQARKMLASDPQNALASPKRLLGRLHTDPEIQAYLQDLGPPVSQSPHGGVYVHARNRPYTVAQICAPIIFALRRVAETYLRMPVEEVVMTAPVSFSQRRYQALGESAALAGLRVVDVVDEPTAAALAHRFDPSFKGLVAVYDFGGGTFDFSVVDVKDADIKVVATAGDTWLGGDDLDQALASAAADAFWRQHKIEIRKQVVQWQRLLLASEAAKRTLSAHQEAMLEVPEIALSAEGPLDLRFNISRTAFSQMCAGAIQRSLDTCSQALELSDISPSELNAIYLSGGTSHVPAVREAVTRFFGKAPRVIVPPERAVVLGAAVHYSLLRSSRIAS